MPAKGSIVSVDFPTEFAKAGDVKEWRVVIKNVGDSGYVALGFSWYVAPPDGYPVIVYNGKKYVVPKWTAVFAIPVRLDSNSEAELKGEVLFSKPGEYLVYIMAGHTSDREFIPDSTVTRTVRVYGPQPSVPPMSAIFDYFYNYKVKRDEDGWARSGFWVEIINLGGEGEVAPCISLISGPGTVKVFDYKIPYFPIARYPGFTVLRASSAVLPYGFIGHVDGIILVDAPGYYVLLLGSVHKEDGSWVLDDYRILGIANEVEWHPPPEVPPPERPEEEVKRKSILSASAGLIPSLIVLLPYIKRK